ncbi:MAG: hypothetical protein ACI4WR_09310 [Bulleidia sp.]
MNRSREEIFQNLLDAGYSRTNAEKFMILVDHGDSEAQRRDLSRNRARILGRIHEENRRLDCLDYLFYELDRGSHMDG